MADTAIILASARRRAWELTAAGEPLNAEALQAIRQGRHDERGRKFAERVEALAGDEAAIDRAIEKVLKEGK